MKIVAEQTFDLSFTEEKVVARLYEPQLEPDGETWVCRLEISEPFNRSLDVPGESSLQALWLALYGVTAALYSAKGYKRGKLGWKGEFGGYLGLPAPRVCHDIAPYPF